MSSYQDLAINYVSCPQISLANPTIEETQFGLQPTMIRLTLMCSGVFDIEGADPFYEALHSSLFEDAHEGGTQGLSSVGGNLGNGSLGFSTLLNETASDLLELEIAGNVGGNENVGQLAGGHEELRDQVDVPVVGSTIFLPRLLAFCEVAILLE